MTEDRWAGYYEAFAGRPVRALLVETLARWAGAPGLAIDVGCGDGTEALHLLEAGWTVLAVDGSPSGLDRTTARTRAHADRITIEQVPLEALDPPPVDLLYSGWTLPFCQPDRFDSLWARLRAALRPGALLTVNLFGPRDDWAGWPGVTIRTTDEARAMGAGLLDLEVVEEERDGMALTGPKHWHEITITGRQPT